MGVDVREHRQVTGFELRSGAVTGVRTPQGPIEGDAVIATVYSWTRPLPRTIGLALPVKCFVHPYTSAI